MEGPVSYNFDPDSFHDLVDIVDELKIKINNLEGHAGFES